MERNSRTFVTSRPALLGVAVMFTLATSVAASEVGHGPSRPASEVPSYAPSSAASAGRAGRARTQPLGTTVDVVADRQSARIGALFTADRADDLAGGHSCTASVVHSPQHDLLVTAAHCVSDTSTDLVFVPGYRDGHAPYGVWKLGHRYLPDGWTKDQDQDSDLAFATVDEPDGKPIEDVVGANLFTPGTATGATPVTVVGYPDSRETPITCTNKPTSYSGTQQRIDCPAFSQGTSGSPWINDAGQVVGVLGGYDQGGDTDDVSYSVTLGSAAADLYKSAISDQ
jgi:V8-like Glu-specific endopeptidase